MTVNRLVAGVLAATALTTGVLLAQRTVGFEWPVSNMDAQRTSWMRADPNISVDSLQQPGFELQWSLKLDPRPRQLESLTTGVTQSGITLFTPVSVIAGSPNIVYAIDNDTGNLFWQQSLGTAPAMGTVECPGVLAAAATRSTNLMPAIPNARAGGGGRGGRGGYQSAVGEPGEGVPMELAVRGGGGRAAAAAAGGARAGAPAGPAPAAAPAAPAGGGAPAQAARGGAAGAPGAPAAAARAGGGGGGGGFGRGGPQLFYTVSNDGMLRILGAASGKDMREPARLVPAGARVADLIAIDETLYATTINGCGGAADGVYALGTNADETPAVRSWRTNGGSPAGPIAFSTDGTLFVAVGPGQTSANGYANAVVALDSATMTVKDWFTQADAAFATGPVVIRHNGRELVAAATTNGRVFLLDPSSLGGSDHGTPLAVSTALASASTDYVPVGLAAWHEVPEAPSDDAPAAIPGVPAEAPQDPPGQAWILMPIGPPAAGAALPGGGTRTNGALVALRVGEANGRLSLTPAWASGDLASPSAPIVVNGVVFVLSRGLYQAAGGAAVTAADRAARSSRAVLYAFDGMTGRELWNSGSTLPTFVSARGPWAANSQVYVPTFDGTVSAFGFAVGRQ